MSNAATFIVSAGESIAYVYGSYVVLLRIVAHINLQFFLVFWTTVLNERSHLGSAYLWIIYF